MAGTGVISQVIGSTFDAIFPEDQLPSIFNAIRVDSESESGKGVSIHLTGEVQQLLGGGRVRAVALGSTDGLVRGMKVLDTGAPVTVPVGTETLGRVFNLLGEPIDKKGPVVTKSRRAIHQAAPDFKELEPKTKIFIVQAPGKFRPALPRDGRMYAARELSAARFQPADGAPRHHL